MRLRFRRHVRESLATELRKLAWWCIGGSALSTAVFNAEGWVIVSAAVAWVTLQGVAHLLLALDENENGTEQ